MDRSDYNKCMIPWMKGGGSERKLRFCIGAKLCSSKSRTEEEARKVCLLPKEPKPLRAKRDKRPVSCKEEMITLGQCMVNEIDMSLVGNAKSIETALVDALLKCQCHS